MYYAVAATAFCSEAIIQLVFSLHSVTYTLSFLLPSAFLTTIENRCSTYGDHSVWVLKSHRLKKKVIPLNWHSQKILTTLFWSLKVPLHWPEVDDSRPRLNKMELGLIRANDFFSFQYELYVAIKTPSFFRPPFLRDKLVLKILTDFNLLILPYVHIL